MFEVCASQQIIDTGGGVVVDWFYRIMLSPIDIPTYVGPDSIDIVIVYDTHFDRDFKS